MNTIKNSSKPFYKFLSGGAGVGKSYLVNALYQTALKYFNSKQNSDFKTRSIMLVAPTGKAAYFIKGNTIHCAFKIVPSRKLVYKPLSARSINSLRKEIGQVELVIIDEISMVGFRMFNCINQRLMELKQTSQPFGGVSVLAVGDLFQLKPVFDCWLFLNPKHDYFPLASNPWVDLFTMYELTDIVRQANEIEFAQLLNRLREAKHTCEDIETLKKRRLTSNLGDAVYPDAVHLFVNNMLVDLFNSKILLSSVNHKLTSTAVDKISDVYSKDRGASFLKSYWDKKDKVLMNELLLVEQMFYEFVVNYDVSDGLMNGATCQVKKLPASSGQLLSDVVWVYFPESSIGAKLRQSNRNLYKNGIDSTWTPIRAHVDKHTPNGGKYVISRKQFPLRPSHAKTIHRAQGESLDEAVIDLSGAFAPHHHYVAISRIRTSQGLHIINLNETAIKVDKAVVKEMERLRNNIRD